jgi:hypothetical protein
MVLALIPLILLGLALYRTFFKEEIDMSKSKDNKFFDGSIIT